jgi:hypothetical protein
MGQKLQLSRAKQKVRRGPPNLPKLVAELHELRQQVRLAEAALQSKTAQQQGGAVRSGGIRPLPLLRRPCPPHSPSSPPASAR